MSRNTAISRWPDTAKIYADMGKLIASPVYTVDGQEAKKYLEYFETKCRKSKANFERASKVIPGGVQHNLSVNHPFPLTISKTEGAYMYDADGNKYIDLLQAGGATLLGNNYKPVIEKVMEVIQSTGPAPGLLTEYEYLLSELICDYMPAVEMVRLFASGTEADMAAVRVARTFTGRETIIKIGGAYHGWSDSLVYALHIPGTGRFESHGIPGSALQKTLECPPNNLERLEELFKKAETEGGIAAVLLEPLGPESATHPVTRDFNKGVRALCDKYGALLIFDEVVTGFRTGMGGAQAYFDVMPDLTVLGKIIAGGFPSAGGVGGRMEIMNSMAAGVAGGHAKRAYVGGTLTANPVSCAGGYYCLREIDAADAAIKAGKAGDTLTDGINKLIQNYKLPFVAFNHASICHLETTGLMHLNPQQPDFEAQFGARRKAMGMMGLALEAEGVIVLAGSRLYTSMADNDDVINNTLAAIDRVFGKLVPQEVK